MATSGYDGRAGRATITGIRTEWTTALLTEPSKAPARP